MKKLQVDDHTRTIKERPVTFTCDWCSQEVTELRYPGPTPKFCSSCAPEAKRLLNTARVRKHRERQAEASPVAKRPVGRPKGS